MIKAGPRNNYHYNHSLLTLAKYNRKNMTKSAASMWKYVLSNKQMLGYQFRRERPILNYIADFVCLELMLIIEVDGWSHENEGVNKKDQQRDMDLAMVGFTTLRFGAWEVLNQISDVSEMIYKWVISYAAVPASGNRKRMVGRTTTSNLENSEGLQMTTRIPPPDPLKGDIA